MAQEFLYQRGTGQKKKTIGYHHQKGMMEATNNTAMGLQHLERLCFVGKHHKMASSMEYNGMISQFCLPKKKQGNPMKSG